MTFDVVRVWKDAMYRHSLSCEEQATLSACPVGGFELTDADLEAVQGGCDQDEGGECSQCSPCERCDHCEHCETNRTRCGRFAFFSFMESCF